MTLMSARANPAATTHHGIWNGTASGGSSPMRITYTMPASTANDAEKVQTRTAGVSDRPRFRRKRRAAEDWTGRARSMLEPTSTWSRLAAVDAAHQSYPPDMVPSRRTWASAQGLTRAGSVRVRVEDGHLAALWVGDAE